MDQTLAFLPSLAKPRPSTSPLSPPSSSIAGQSPFRCLKTHPAPSSATTAKCDRFSRSDAAIRRSGSKFMLAKLAKKKSKRCRKSIHFHQLLFGVSVALLLGSITAAVSTASEASALAETSTMASVSVQKHAQTTALVGLSTPPKSIDTGLSPQWLVFPLFKGGESLIQNQFISALQNGTEQCWKCVWFRYWLLLALVPITCIVGNILVIQSNLPLFPNLIEGNRRRLDDKKPTKSHQLFAC